MHGLHTDGLDLGMQNSGLTDVLGLGFHGYPGQGWTEAGPCPCLDSVQRIFVPELG